MIDSGAHQVNDSAFFVALFEDVFSALASIFHLTVINVERYVTVSRPSKSLLTIFLMIRKYHTYG